MKRRDRKSYWNVACRNVMALQNYYEGLLPLRKLGLGAQYATADAKRALMNVKAYYHWKSTSTTGRAASRIHWDSTVDKALDDLRLWKARDAGRAFDALVDMIDHGDRS